MCDADAATYLYIYMGILCVVAFCVIFNLPDKNTRSLKYTDAQMQTLTE